MANNPRAPMMAARAAYPIRSFLDCSTLHLSPATRRWLAEQMALPPDERAVVGGAMPFGWFLYVPVAEAVGVVPTRAPADLVQVWRHALARGCEYVNLDADASADANPRLPGFADTELDG